MEKLQDQVKDICKLADAVIKNPALTVVTTASSAGLSSSVISFAAGGLFIPGIVYIGPITYIVIWVWKKLSDKQKRQQEKERMLRDVIRSQQAVIRALKNKERFNRQEIDNLKEMLRLLEEAGEVVKVA